MKQHKGFTVLNNQRHFAEWERKPDPPAELPDRILPVMKHPLLFYCYT